MNSFSQNNLVVKIRSVVVEIINKSYPWGYFDGSAVGESKSCGAGDMQYISKERYFSFKAGLGLGTNNLVELCALKLPFSLAREKHISKFQIFGDSLLVIYWANGMFRCLNLELLQVLNEINRLSDFFDLVDLKHIYRERNF